MASNSNFDNFNTARVNDRVHFPFLECFPLPATHEQKIGASLLLIMNNARDVRNRRYKGKFLFLSVFELYWHVRQLPESHRAREMMEEMMQNDGNVLALKAEYFEDPEKMPHNKDACIECVQKKMQFVFDVLFNEYGRGKACYRNMPLWMYQYCSKIIYSLEEYPALVQFSELEPLRAVLYETVPAEYAVFAPPSAEAVKLMPEHLEEGQSDFMDEPDSDAYVEIKTDKKKVMSALEHERHKARVAVTRKDQVLKIFFHHTPNRIRTTYYFKDMDRQSDSKGKKLVREAVDKFVKEWRKIVS